MPRKTGEPVDDPELHSQTNGGAETESRSVTRRRVLKAAGATGVCSTATLSGCLASADVGPDTVQIAGNTDVKNNIGEIERKLHEVGLSEDIELSAIAGAASSGARKQQYNRWLSANLSQPSLFMMDSGWTIPFIAREQLVNVSEAKPDLADHVQEKYFETFVRSLESRDGNLYGIPLFPTTGNMLYRKDLVKEAGFKPDEEKWATNPLSWQQFSEVAKQTAEKTDTKWGFSFQANAYEGLSCCDFKEFTGTWGGSYFGAKENLFGPVNGRPVTVDSEPVRKATRMVKTFIDADSPEALDSIAGDISPRAVLQWQEETSRKPFSNGNVVMHRNWPYAIAIDGAEEKFGEDLGVMPIPYGVTQSEAKYEGYGGTVPSLGGWHIGLNPNTEQRDEALQVMEAMTSEKFQLFLFETLGWLPPKPELFESERAREVPVMGRYLETLRLSLENAAPRPVTVAWPQQSTKIAQKASAALSGETSTEQAMQTLAGQLEEIEEASERKTTGTRATTAEGS